MEDGLVGGTDDRAAVDQLLHPVRAPAYAARDREKRGVEVFRDPEHVVDQAGIQIDVGADVFRARVTLLDDRRAEFLDHLVEPHLIRAVLFTREFGGHRLQYLRPRIGHGVHGMTETVDKPGFVAGLAVGDP